MYYFPSKYCSLVFSHAIKLLTKKTSITFSDFFYSFKEHHHNLLNHSTNRTLAFRLLFYCLRGVLYFTWYKLNSQMLFPKVLFL